MLKVKKRNWWKKISFSGSGKEVEEEVVLEEHVTVVERKRRNEMNKGP